MEKKTWKDLAGDKLANLPIPNRNNIIESKQEKQGVMSTFSEVLTHQAKTKGKNLSMNNTSQIFASSGFSEMADEVDSAATFLIPLDSAFANLSEETKKHLFPGEGEDSTFAEAFAASHIITTPTHPEDFKDSVLSLETAHASIGVNIIGPRTLPSGVTDANPTYVEFVQKTTDPDTGEVASTPLGSAKVVAYDKQKGHSALFLDNTYVR